MMGAVYNNNFKCIFWLQTLFERPSLVPALNVAQVNLSDDVVSCFLLISHMYFTKQLGEYEQNMCMALTGGQPASNSASYVGQSAPLIEEFQA